MFCFHFRAFHFGVIFVLCLAIGASPAFALTIKEEQELAREFIKVLRRQAEFVEDPLINEYVDRVGRKIVAQVPTQPFEFEFHIIKEEVYNAFAIPAGHIFINSGLLMVMEQEDELAGILAHEIAHVVCRHIDQRIERSKKIDLATMAGMVAGIFLGAASGSPEVTQSMIFGAAAAGQSAYLGYSRDDEQQADQLSLNYIVNAGYSVNRLIDVFQKIRSQDWFGSVVPSYLKTHPDVEQRMVNIDSWLATHPQPVLSKEKDDTFAFRRMVLRLRALYDNPKDAERLFSTALKKNENDSTLNYGYGLLLSRLGRNSEAAAMLRKALASKALDPVILTELGRIHFLEGRFDEALSILEGVDALPGDNAEAMYFLGRTQLSLGNYEKAVKLFEYLINHQRTYTSTYYYLGEAYSKLGDEGNSHYQLGQFHYWQGDFKLADFHLKKARQLITDPNKLKRIDQMVKETERTNKQVGSN